jgi:hypothetical protein
VTAAATQAREATEKKERRERERERERKKKVIIGLKFPPVMPTGLA